MMWVSNDQDNSSPSSESDSNSQNSGKVFEQPPRFSRNRIIFFAVTFSIIGGYSIYRSFAATTSTSTPTSQFTGTLQTLHGDDFNNKITRDFFTLVTDSGDRIPINIENGQSPDYDGQSRVRVRGALSNGTIQVKSADDIKLRQIAVPTDTPHKTAVVLFNFKSQPIESVSPTDLKSMVFTGSKSANAFFKEESFGLRTLTGITQNEGDVFGYYTIKADDSNCDYQQWSYDVNAVALAAGNDLSRYDNVIYVTGSVQCPYGGLGQVGGPRSWIFNVRMDTLDRSSAIIKHEMTHNFGTWHANSLKCYTDISRGQPTFVSSSSVCQSYEYGDPFDVMGYNIYSGHTYHSNNYFLHKLGWIPDSQVITVTESGDYTLVPQEYASSGTKALRLIRSVNERNEIQYLYLEYRQPSGFDDFVAGIEPVDGVSARLTSGSEWSTRSYILHTRIDNKWPYYTMKDNSTFEDKDHHIKVTQLSHNSDQARVHIDVSDVPQLDKIPPTAPTTFQLLDSTTKFITFGFTPSPEADATAYRIYRNGEFVGSAYPDYYTTPDTASARFQDSLPYSRTLIYAPGRTITYTVSAEDWNGNVSKPSIEFKVQIPPRDTQAPSAPKSLRVSRDSFNVARLSWTASTDNRQVYGYIVYRVDSKGLIQRFDTRAYNYNPDYPFFKDYFRARGAKYTYYIQAYDADLNKSLISNKVKK